jgi:hypothetical protein
MALEDELGITGDDADDLFRDFAKQFPDVCLDELNLDRYFGPEAGWMPFPRRRCARSLMVVADLVRAAREKRWPST